MCPAFQFWLSRPLSSSAEGTLGNVDNDIASLDVESELTGEFDRTLALSSMVSPSPVDAMLERVDCRRSFSRTGDVTTFARARLTIETEAIVAGVTVMVDVAESLFSLSFEKSTCSSSP